MNKYFYNLLPAFLILITLIACKKTSADEIKPDIQPDGLELSLIVTPGTNPTDSIVKALYERNSSVALRTVVSENLRGGTFNYRPASMRLNIDNGICFAAKDGGFWERETSDTIKLSWFNLNTENQDNSDILRKGIQAAINRQALVVIFPFSGVYRVKSSNYWNVSDRCKLQIDGRGAVIQVDGEAAEVAQETYVMAFRCTETSNSLNSRIAIKNLGVKAPDIKPQWTNVNYSAHRLVMAIETDGIHTVEVSNCKLDDICGYGIRLKNFVSANIDKVTEKNVGGHFPIENGFDSFGDGIWLGHYDVETVRSSRKRSYVKITNSVIQGYDTGANGNFASRSGITVEGFSSYGPDIVVKVDVENCSIADYDRNLHVEGISSDLRYANCKLRNFFGIALIVNSIKTALTYNACKASGQLVSNPVQERLGLGGVVQFGSTVDLFLTNKTVFTMNAPATFRANFHIQDESILDFGNSDVFFDHANLYVNGGGSMINLPGNVGRGFNMYGGSIDFDNATFSGYGKTVKGVLHGENIATASIKNSKLNNSRLFFTGGFGVVQQGN